MKKNLVFLCVVVTLLLVLPVTGAACKLKNNPSTMIHADAELKLGAGYKTLGSSICTVEITNQDKFDWHNVKLTVDELFVYKTRLDVIKAGQKVILSLADYFEGTFPFDITKYKPAKVGVIADEGSYFWGWTNREELAKQ